MKQGGLVVMSLLPAALTPASLLLDISLSVLSLVTENVVSLKGRRDDRVTFSKQKANVPDLTSAKPLHVVLY